MEIFLPGGAMECHALIVAGFGFRTSATVESLRDALGRTGGTPDALATAEDKARQPVFRALAKELNLPVIAVDSAALVAQEVTTQSQAALAARGTGSVAEAAALAALKHTAQVLCARQISNDRQATCALAEGDRT